MKKYLIITSLVLTASVLYAQNTLDRLGLTSTSRATGAYSLRLLSSSYAGYAAQVRRGSDDAVLEVGFTADGGLDTVALKTFAGESTCYVQVWYDQSGGERNMINGDGGTQPRILFDGHFKYVGSRVTLEFAGYQYLMCRQYTTVYSTGSVIQSSQPTFNGLHSVLSVNYFISGTLEPYGTTFNENYKPFHIWKNGIEIDRNASLAPVDVPMTLGFSNVPERALRFFIGHVLDGPADGEIWEPEVITFENYQNTSRQRQIACNQGRYYSIATDCNLTIHQQPSEKAVIGCTGIQVPMLSVEASGADLSFQWFKNSTAENNGGTLLDGATNYYYFPDSTLIGTNYYYVRVSDGNGAQLTSNVSGVITIAPSMSATVSNASYDCHAYGVVRIAAPQAPPVTLINEDFLYWVEAGHLEDNANIIDGACILTDSTGEQTGKLVFEPIAATPANLTIQFTYQAQPTAVGETSFIYGLMSTLTRPEDGVIGQGLAIRFQDHFNRIELLYNNFPRWSGIYTSVGNDPKHFTITLSADGHISIQANGIGLLNNFLMTPTYSFDDKTGWQFAFASAAWMENSRHRLLNVLITGSAYEYSIDNENWQTNSNFDVPYGNYNVGMRLPNSSACPVTSLGEIILTAPIGNSIALTGFTTGNGSVTLRATGSDSYVWSGGINSNNAINTFTSSGTYDITSTDVNGCHNDTSVTVTVNKNGITKYGSVSGDFTQQVDEKGALATGVEVDRFGHKRSTLPADGSSAERAGSSAWQIKQTYPAAQDGLYWIKHPELNGGAPFQIYADMTTDGGGWTLILCNVSPNPGWNNDNALLRNESAPDNVGTYSIIGWADKIKSAASGFQYMLEAGERNANGGIWTANEAYSFVSTSNANTNITLNTKFGTWEYGSNSIQQRMPWYGPGNEALITTLEDPAYGLWGSLVVADGYSPAPWMTCCLPDPGIIRYWVR